MDSIRVSEAPDSGSIPDEATKEEARKRKQETGWISTTLRVSKVLDPGFPPRGW